MASDVRIERSNYNGQRTLAMVSNGRSFIETVRTLKAEMDHIIADGVAEMVAVYGFEDVTQAQAFYDRINGFVSYLDDPGGALITLSEYMTKQDELLYPTVGI